MEIQVREKCYYCDGEGYDNKSWSVDSDECKYCEGRGYNERFVDTWKLIRETIQEISASLGRTGEHYD